MECYTNRFRKLLTRATQGVALDARFQVNYYITSLLPTYVSQVVLSAPADLNIAVNRAKLVETGVRSTLQNAGLTPSVATTTIATTVPKAEPTLDEITKQMQQLSLNYANLTTALLAKTDNHKPRTTFNNNQKYQRQPSKIICYKCQKPGHIARNCTSKGKK